MGRDPIREVYAVHPENSRHRRSPLGKRLIGRSESPDGIAWSEPETILVPDTQDPSDTEFYGMPCVAYEGLYVGLLWIFRTTNTTHHPAVPGFTPRPRRSGDDSVPVSDSVRRRRPFHKPRR